MLEDRPIYDGRDYALFAILADVRNDGKRKSITDYPKGLPGDCSEAVKRLALEWGDDGHSHSYLNLRELKEYYKSTPHVVKSGMVSEEWAKIIDDGGVPNAYCKYTTNKKWKHKEWSIQNPIREIIENMETRKKEVFSIYDNLEHPEYDEDIRVVFWFDN
jgi:hypothetical protein